MKIYKNILSGLFVVSVSLSMDFHNLAFAETPDTKYLADDGIRFKNAESYREYVDSIRAPKVIIFGAYRGYMKEEHEYKSEPTEEDRYDITAYKSPYNYLLVNRAISQTETMEPSPRMSHGFMDVDQDVTKINTALLGEGEYDLVIFEHIPIHLYFSGKVVYDSKYYYVRKEWRIH